MAEDPVLPLLPLPLVLAGRAKSETARSRPSQTDENRRNAANHSTDLETQATTVIAGLRAQRSGRRAPAAAVVPSGSSLLLEVDEIADLDFLRAAFGFEIVAEEENGYVIVTTEDNDLTELFAKIKMFGAEERGGGAVAKVYRLAPEGERLQHILSPALLDKWPTIRDNEEFLIDVAVSCDGGMKYPDPREREDDESEEHYDEWKVRNREALDRYYQLNDEVQLEREQILHDFVAAYEGEVLSLEQDTTEDPAQFADSFTARIRISGRGFRDLAQNLIHVFEISEPDEFTPLDTSELPDKQPPPLSLNPPSDDAPAVCVIDSGIQEGHRLLAPAIDSQSSHCFLPGIPATTVADYVQNGGHGTRVAGAVLYKDDIPTSGVVDLPFWIQNARVLDANCGVPQLLFPPTYMRDVVERYIASDKHTRIYNHSINSNAPHRTRHMSAWAAEIDLLSYKYDVLIIQSVGNLRISGSTTLPGIVDYIAADKQYPQFLYSEASARVSNPAQSFQALTVGSISYEQIDFMGEKSFAQSHGPSVFSRSGLGIWGAIKPDVVEYGGDYAYNIAQPTALFKRDEICPNLVRATRHGGPETSRDTVGTSFSAPKVTHLAATLAQVLPNESPLLYRALIAQSARWPAWADAVRDKLSVVRSIGYGIPEIDRATSNTPYRVTTITNGLQFIRARQAHIYQIPIPESLRSVADEYKIRIDITLSYAARPRRTRRSHKRYLSTWLSWKTNAKNEDYAAFRKSVFKTEASNEESREGFQWTIHERSNWGSVNETHRSLGTLQKDWTIVKPFDLPASFNVAVIGHEGWDKHPDATAKYSLAVTFEVLGREVEIYEEIRAGIEQLVQTVVENPVEATI